MDSINILTIIVDDTENSDSHIIILNNNKDNDNLDVH